MPKILKQIADVKFPTRWAIFRLLAFEAFHAGGKTANQRRETALALVLGDLYSYPPLVRIHSQCTTGEAFHSLRCDCHDQLQVALSAIAEEGAGVLVYEQQEGRGIGLMEKLRAYRAPGSRARYRRRKSAPRPCRRSARLCACGSDPPFSQDPIAAPDLKQPRQNQSSDRCRNSSRGARDCGCSIESPFQALHRHQA